MANQVALSLFFGHEEETFRTQRSKYVLMARGHTFTIRTEWFARDSNIHMMVL